MVIFYISQKDFQISVYMNHARLKDAEELLTDRAKRMKKLIDAAVMDEYGYTCEQMYMGEVLFPRDKRVEIANFVSSFKPTSK